MHSLIRIQHALIRFSFFGALFIIKCRLYAKYVTNGQYLELALIWSYLNSLFID